MQTPEPPKRKEPETTSKQMPEAQPVAWEEFLEDDADCCGGCNHKPR